MHLKNGKINKQNDYEEKQFLNEKIKKDSIISCVFNEKKGDITYFVDNKLIGVAFSDLNEELFPAISFNTPDDEIELLETNITLKNEQKKINIFEKEIMIFDNKKISNIDKIEKIKNNKFLLDTKGKCSKYRYAVGNKGITLGSYYFEVKMIKIGSCYSAVGFCTNETYMNDKYERRLGDDKFGWAMRTYGVHSDLQFSGMRHNGISRRSFEDWKDGDIVGAYINLNKNIIVFLRNREILKDCVYTNVTGSIFYPVVQICHDGCPIEVRKIIFI